MRLNNSIVAEWRVVKFKSVVVLQQVRQQFCQTSTGDRRDEAAAGEGSDKTFCMGMSLFIRLGR